MGTFEDLLYEKIDSKRIRYDVAKALQKHVSTEDSAKLLTQVKRAVKELLDEYVPDSGIKKTVSVQLQNRTMASASTIMDRKDQTIREVKVVIHLDRSRMGSKKFSTDLFDSIVHEFVHVVQNVRANFENQKSMVRNKDRSGEFRAVGVKKYLSNRMEIEAYAVNTVQELQNSGATTKGLGKVLRDERKLKALALHKSSQSLTDYYVHFHQSDDPADQKIWQLYVKKVLQHI